MGGSATPYFTTDAASKLTIDEDLRDLGMGFDDPKFLETAIEELTSGDQDRGKHLLARYVPEGPDTARTADWRAWHDENKPYLFATDFGHYRWYVDPLAKKRGVPTTELRGRSRMDQRSFQTDNAAAGGTESVQVGGG